MNVWSELGLDAKGEDIYQLLVHDTDYSDSMSYVETLLECVGQPLTSRNCDDIFVIGTDNLLVHVGSEAECERIGRELHEQSGVNYSVKEIQ